MKSFRSSSCLVVLLTLVCLFCALGSALADRDIVYSARYYLPRGSKGSSHFHLYRINPNGSGRTQITFGNQDDQHPTWSPNGRLIVFQRDSSIAVLDSTTLRVRTLLRALGKYWFFKECAWSPDSKMVCIFADTYSNECAYLVPIAGGKTQKLAGADEGEWSPDGSRIFASLPKGDEILDLGTGKRIPVAMPQQEETLPGYHSVIWLDNHSLAGICEGTSETHPQAVLLGDDGNVKKQVLGSIVFDPTVGDSGPGSLMPPPLGGSEVTYVRDASISTWRAYDFYLLNLQTGKVGRELAESQFLAWSPDHQSFCSAPHRDLSDYEGKGNDARTVWTAPLQIGSRNSNYLRTITPGLVWVTDADWRKHGH